MSTRNVEPADCAIGVAIPLTREELVADLHDLRKEFATLFRDQHVPGAPPDVVWSIYGPRARIVTETLRAVGRMGQRKGWFSRGRGVTAVSRLSLGALRDLLCNHHVVTLIAHLSPREIVSPSEITDPSAILQRARSGKGLVEQSIRLRCSYLWAIESEPIEDARSAVAAMLTEMMGVPLQTDQPISALTRVDMEEVFSPWLADAPILELYEGLITWRQLLSVIPNDFQGILDLSLCQSTVIADALKRRRPGSLVVVNRGSADLRFRALFYRSIIESLRSEPRPFTDAVIEMHTALLEKLCER